MRSQVYTVISTFSGCGGSSLGYEMAGFKVLLAIENNQHACQTYKTNFPNTLIWERDIQELSVNQALQIAKIKKGELDVLDGSPPCQGFSTAGQRKFNDARNSLFQEFSRLLKGLQPRTFVMENVSGMAKGKMKFIFIEILKELKACGYKVRAKQLNTKWFGVPQSRERIIFIGARNDLEVEPIFPKPHPKLVTTKEALSSVVVQDRPLITNKKGLALWKLVKPGKGFNSVHKKKHWWNARKLDPKKPSPTVIKTIMATGCAGLFHWEKPRLLTISEYKRLSSFPDDFKLGGDLKKAVERIGNSVPPLFMKAIAESLKDQLSQCGGFGNGNS